MQKNIFVIAIITTKDVLRQPMFYYITGTGTFLTLCSLSFTLFAFGEEIKMIQEMGTSMVFLCCLFLAAMCTSNAISKEIEKGTILNLLSKPVCKQIIILGKFLGILIPVFTAYSILGVVHMACLGLKYASLYNVDYSVSLSRVCLPTITELLYLFLQVIILSAIATAGSVFFPMASNLCLCVFLYVMGNFDGVSYISSRITGGGFPWLESLLSMALPNLGALKYPANGNSFWYFLAALLYTVIFASLTLLISCKLFELKEC